MTRRYLWSQVLPPSLCLSSKPDFPPSHSAHRHWLPSCICFSTSYSRGPSWPRDWTRVSCFAGGFFTTEIPRKPLHLLFCLNHPFLLLRPKNTDWYTKSKSRNKNSNDISQEVSWITLEFFPKNTSEYLITTQWIIWLKNKQTNSCWPHVYLQPTTVSLQFCVNYKQIWLTQEGKR